jgi:hypothetical protein
MKKHDNIMKYLGRGTSIAVLDTTTFDNEDKFGIGRTTRIDIAPRYEILRNPKQLINYMDRLESGLKNFGVEGNADVREAPFREAGGFFTGWIEYHDYLGSARGSTENRGDFIPSNLSLLEHTIFVGRLKKAGFSETSLAGEWNAEYNVPVVQKTIIRPFPSMKYGKLHTGDVEERFKIDHDDSVPHSWGIGGKALTVLNELFG